MTEDKDKNEPFDPEDMLEEQEETGFEEFQQANTQNNREKETTDTSGHPIEARHLEIDLNELERLEQRYEPRYAEIIAEDVIVPELEDLHQPPQINLQPNSEITRYILQNNKPFNENTVENQREAGFYLATILEETREYLQQEGFQELLLTMPSYEDQQIQTINLDQPNKYFNTFLDFFAAETERNGLQEYIQNETTQTETSEIMTEIDRISDERIKDYNNQNSAYRELKPETDALLRRFNDGQRPLYQEPIMEGLLYGKISQLDQKPDEN